MLCCFHDPFRLKVMPVISKLRGVFMRKKQVDAIVHRHNQLRRIEKRCFVMRHMNDIDILALQREWNRYVMTPRALIFRLIHLLEIVWKRPELVKVSMRPDEQVLVLRIDRGEIPHQIPDVCTYTELVNFADVDRDAHTL